ncbi:MAG: hypothetical protein M0T71_08825 [Actinomycetota bacterium]|nr:hypothetical protein [Actinomycetota bacterium]
MSSGPGRHPTSLLATATLVGRMRAVELAAFALLGRRARAAAPPGLAAFLAGASHAHAWRAGQLEGHLPVSVTLPSAGDLTVTAGPHVERALRLLEDGEDAPLVAALGTALYPAMLAGYDARLALASPAADPPLVRTLGRLRHDLAALAEEARRHADGPGGGRTALADACADALAPLGPFGPIGHPTSPPAASSSWSGPLPPPGVADRGA